MILYQPLLLNVSNGIPWLVIFCFVALSSFSEGWISSTNIIAITRHGRIYNCDCIRQSIHPSAVILSKDEQECSQRNNRCCGLYSMGDSDDDNYDADDDYDEDEDVSELVGDWRAFRNKLAMEESSSSSVSSTDISHGSQQNQNSSKSSKANQELLKKQNKHLAKEDIWAHVTSSVEVGGLVVRMPLEMELAYLAQQEQRSSTSTTSSRAPPTLAGKKLAQQYGAKDAIKHRTPTTSTWYDRAQKYMQEQLQKLSALGGGANGKAQSIDVQKISPEQEELLQLYIDSHSHWQEVCLVIERSFAKGEEQGGIEKEENNVAKDEEECRKVALVLNRPMALKMGNALAQLILYGAMGSKDEQGGLLGGGGTSESTTVDPRQLIFFLKFVNAFQNECGVYVGGRDHQEEPATVIHGHKDVPDAIEVAPNVGIYVGGDMEHIVDGITKGIYQPLDFRFFVGCHDFSSPSPPPSSLSNDADGRSSSKGSKSTEGSSSPHKIQLGASSPSLDLAVLMGKYQPISCSRTLALKQCIGLPKPLWHETLDLCGGDMAVVSQKEMTKRVDMDQNSGTVKVQIFDKDDNDIRPQENDVNKSTNNDDGDDDDVIVDQLNELFELGDEDDDDDDVNTKEAGTEQQGQNGGRPFYDDGSSSAFQ